MKIVRHLANIVQNQVNLASLVRQSPAPWFNIQMSAYQYRKSHCEDKTILRPSYLHNGISYTGKVISLYWIRALRASTAVVLTLSILQSSPCCIHPRIYGRPVRPYYCIQIWARWEGFMKTDTSTCLTITGRLTTYWYKNMKLYIIVMLSSKYWNKTNLAFSRNVKVHFQEM